MNLKGLHKHTRQIIEWARAHLDENGKGSLRTLYYAQSDLKGMGFSYKAMKNPLKVARLREIIDYDEIVDRTRECLDVPMWPSLAAFAPDAVVSYRQDIWSTQRFYVEVWCESDATVTYLQALCWELGVVLQPCRGDMGLHAIHKAAKRFKPHIEAGRPAHVIYCGDWNPKGEQIPQSIKANLWKRHGVRVKFTRVAILPAQIDKYRLPSRRGKANSSDPVAIAWHKIKGKDTRHVELEAMPSRTLIPLVRRGVVAKLDLKAVARKLPVQTRTRREIARRLGVPGP